VPEAALLLAVLVGCYLGFAALAMAQERHWRRAVGHGHPSPARVIGLRIAGAAALVLALGLALLRDGASFGAILWTAALTVGALAVAGTLTWRARWLRPLALSRGRVGVPGRPTR
jgi:hypothetical protein